MGSAINSSSLSTVWSIPPRSERVTEGGVSLMREEEGVFPLCFELVAADLVRLMAVGELIEVVLIGFSCSLRFGVGSGSGSGIESVLMVDGCVVSLLGGSGALREMWCFRYAPIICLLSKFVGLFILVVLIRFHSSIVFFFMSLLLMHMHSQLTQN